MNSPTPSDSGAKGLRSTPGYLNNFRDPIGLAKRMIFSGNRAAYWAMGREVTRPLVMPADWLMKIAERKRLRNAGELTQPVLLIVGPPRGGTTVLYQLLASQLATTWFPNISEMFPRSPITASRLFAWKRNKSRGLKSFYGQTGGLSAPNDGFHIWNRWFGEDRYTPTLAKGAETDIQQFLAAWTNTFDRPLVNKNNRNSLCIPVLAETIPTAHFVVLSRDPSDIVRSLIRAREFVQGTRTAAWGVASRAENQDSELGYVNDVCQQVGDVVTHLTHGMAAIPEDQFTRVSYEDLCVNGQEIVEAIAARSGIKLSGTPNFSALRTPQRRLLSPAEETRIEECLQSVLPQQSGPPRPHLLEKSRSARPSERATRPAS